MRKKGCGEVGRWHAQVVLVIGGDEEDGAGEDGKRGGGEQGDGEDAESAAGGEGDGLEATAEEQDGGGVDGELHGARGTAWAGVAQIVAASAN